MGQQPSKNSLYIKITLGQTQSHQLFDFQNGGIEQQSLILNNLSYLIDKGETVQFFNQQQYQLLQNNNITPDINILKVTLDPLNQIRIQNITSHPNQPLLWRCIKPNQAHPIKPGDMIKIGKIKLQLKKIVQRKQQSYIQQETVKDYHQQASQQHNNDDLQSLRSGHSSCDRCRICFRSFNVKNDPLLCLCKCSGSIKWIHFMCLKDWISNNFQKREDDYCKFYTYHETNCELCKHSLPNQFKHQGRSYSFLDFRTFQPPYAQFEYVQVQNNKRKFYKYIISLAKDKQVVIGRNNSSQVVMKDISISRTHCSLQYNHGVLLLRDKKSKFGTLVKLQKQTDFSSQNGLQLQYDSKIIQLFNNNTFKSCCQDVDSYRLIYENDGIMMIGNDGDYNSNSIGQRRENNNSDHQRMLMMRIDAGGSGHQVSSRQQQSSQNHSHHYLNRAIQQAQQNSQQPIQRTEATRLTMIRETIARIEAIRY